MPRSIPIISFPDAPLAAVRLQRHILFAIPCFKAAFRKNLHLYEDVNTVYLNCRNALGLRKLDGAAGCVKDACTRITGHQHLFDTHYGSRRAKHVSTSCRSPYYTLAHDRTSHAWPTTWRLFKSRPIIFSQVRLDSASPQRMLYRVHSRSHLKPQHGVMSLVMPPVLGTWHSSGMHFCPITLVGK